MVQLLCRISFIRRLHQGIRTQIVKRPPVVTIMGHVDHGKTTLLDHLRNSQIVKQEFGGITQHIGAFVVPFKQKNNTELVTFLDTPGHAAFAAMRQRGADITDIVVLVVACDDGVLDQTIESINYAKKSQVPIIVAVNKVDKFSSTKEMEKNISLIRQQLTVCDVITEADGGDVQLVHISALKGQGIEELKESILALSETLMLRSEIDCPMRGHIIESHLSQHRGKVATVLVQAGQLIKGDYIISGTTNWAKVRALFDERNKLQQSCGPGLPIQITGWREDNVPAAGDPVMQVKDEAEAKKIINDFKSSSAMKRAETDAQLAAERARQYNQLYKEKLKEKREAGIRYGRIRFTQKGIRPKEVEEDPLSIRKINMILKCDVDGSLDAILDVLDTYDKDNKQLVKLDLMHYGVGSINESDMNMACAFPNSIIYGFNVKPSDQKILLNAKQNRIPVKLFNVIYHLIDDLKQRISEKIPELEREVEMAKANVIQEFVITETNKSKVHVAGCRCSQGTLKRGLFYRLLRNRELIADNMEVKTLKHLKEEAKEITKDQECGISFIGHEKLEFKPGDVLLAFERVKYRPPLKWQPKGF